MVTTIVKKRKRKVAKETKTNSIRFMMIKCPKCKRHVAVMGGVEIISLDPKQSIECQQYGGSVAHFFEIKDGEVLSEHEIKPKKCKKVTKKEIAILKEQYNESLKIKEEK